MLYALADWLSNWFSPFNAFTYLTSRVIFGALTALLLSIGFGGRMIALLRRLQMGQYVRDDGPQTHLKKAGTPTMGGALIILSVCIAMLLWADLRVKYTWIALFVMLGFGVVGWIDDYRKLILKDPQGLRAKHKYALLSLVSLLTCIWLYVSAASPVETTLYVPFFKNLSWQMGWLFLPFVYFVLTGASNAVNLTDGLDGLAAFPVVLVAGGMAVFAYATGHWQFARYLQLPFVPGANEVMVFCAAMCGACLGYLRSNAAPAQVFMGDVGALALGAALGTVAVIVRQEFVLVIMGGLFVVEALSVMLQVGWYKRTKKRIFLMAPIHHHFEQKGWKETQVVVRFWIITIVLVLVGLSTLKIR